MFGVKVGSTQLRQTILDHITSNTQEGGVYIGTHEREIYRSLVEREQSWRSEVKCSDGVIRRLPQSKSTHIEGTSLFRFLYNFTCIF